jgi:hypothetical protein
VHYLTDLLDSVVRVSPLFHHNYVVPTLNALPVQGFFAARIYTLSKKLLIPVLIWVLGFLRFVGTIGMLVTALDSDSAATYVARWEWIFTSDFSLGVANDVIITATLVFWFYRQRRDARRGYVH